MTKQQTSVSITLAVDEGISSTQAMLFSNGKAQLPISVYVNSGGAEILEVGIADAQLVTNGYDIDNPSTRFPLPSQLTAVEVESGDINERIFKSYPNCIPQPALDSTLYANRTLFFVKSSSNILNVSEQYRCNIMAYVRVSNYYTGVGGESEEPQEIVICSWMNAENTAGLALQFDERIDITLEGKPPLSIVTNCEDISDYTTDLDGGSVMFYRTTYGEYDNKYTVDLKDKQWRIEDRSNQTLSTPCCEQHDLSTDPNDQVYEFGFEGTTGSINVIARAVGHGFAETANITQVTNNENRDYHVDRDDAISAASCFWLKSSHIYNDCCNQATVEYVYVVTAEDFYGGSAEKRTGVDVDATGSGAAHWEDL